MTEDPLIELVKREIKDENLLEHGYEIRRTILKWTGIPTSVGIANTKTLSKVANHIAKKNKTGVIYLYKDIDDHLKNFYVSDIWGVGKQLSKLYEKNGITTAYQLKNISNSWVKKSTNVLGARTVMELRGIPCVDFEIEEVKRKRKMAVFKSPGVFVKEVDISIVKHSKRYSRRIKIGKIFGIDVPNVIITSTPKGLTNFPEMW